MLNDILKIFFRFVLLVMLQVIVLNNIQLGGFVNPYLYVLFVLMLPVRIPKLSLLALSFLCGLTIDVFSNTMGMHAAACTFMAFVRPGVLRLLAPREGYEAEASPSVKEMAFNWFLLYAAVMIFLHHLLLFYLEVFRLSEFFSTFLRVLASSLATLTLVVLSQFLLVRSKKER